MASISATTYGEGVYPPSDDTFLLVDALEQELALQAELFDSDRLVEQRSLDATVDDAGRAAEMLGRGVVGFDAVALAPLHQHMPLVCGDARWSAAELDELRRLVHDAVGRRTEGGEINFDASSTCWRNPEKRQQAAFIFPTSPTDVQPSAAATDRPGCSACGTRPTPRSSDPIRQSFS